MTITVVLKDEAAQMVERRSLLKGRYPDAESSGDGGIDAAGRCGHRLGRCGRHSRAKMIAEADAEGGEIPFDEAIRELDKVIAAPRR